MSKQRYTPASKNENSSRQNENSNDRNNDFYNPYTFIPLSDKIYTLSESDQNALDYCHDIPFQDGVSGNIEVGFEAITPLCIRGEQQESVKMGSHYYIPGTSVKGMIRNVFEIITFSNIQHFMANNRYSIRDFTSKDYQLKTNNPLQKSGFLLQLQGKYYIVPCSRQKLNYKEIEKRTGVFLKNLNVNAKYQKIGNKYIFQTNKNWYMWFFSGKMNNKKHEYLFTIPQLGKAPLIPLEETEYQDFIFIHQKENENQNWKVWKNKLKNYNTLEAIAIDQFKGIVPCFFRTQPKGKQTIVKDLGFAFLYRQPYKKTLYDCLPECCKNEAIDLTQAVFGFASEKKALKGRVQFTNTYILNPQPTTQQTFILNSPKPSYYPFYLKQETSGVLATYSSAEAQIAGWKRPLIHARNCIGNLPTSNTTSSFIPLAAGCKFNVNIKIHNLRRYELGALLAAITFCNHPECYHSLGYGKVMGYGKLKITNVKLNIQNNDLSTQSISQNDFIQEFKNKLLKAGITEAEWKNFCKPLITIASGQYTPKTIRYPSLKPNEFKYIKQNKKSLKNFSPKIP